MRRDGWRGGGRRRFWGKPHKRPAEFSGEHLHRMLRATDIDCKIAALIPEGERQARVKGITPKSVFQVGGAGSVGTASLRGFAVLLRLREAGFRVWPFDAPALVGRAASAGGGDVYAVEYGGGEEVECGGAGGLFVEEAERGCGVCGVVAGRDAEGGSGEDAFDALVSTMVMAERRETFATLPMPRDPLCGIEGWTWAPEV